MVNSENGERTICETKAMIDFVKTNWTDSVGKQYVFWLEQTLEKLKQLEQHREMIWFKTEKIALLCEQVITTDDDSPKVLKKIR